MFAVRLRLMVVANAEDFADLGKKRQGTEAHWRLDSNDQLCRWPGFIIKTTEPNAYDMYLLESNKGIDRFYVNSGFIIGKSSGGWFAINRATHQAWEPYPTKQSLQLACGVEFSESELTTSCPWSRLIIYRCTKITIALITLLFLTLLFLIWRPCSAPKRIRP